MNRKIGKYLHSHFVNRALRTPVDAGKMQSQTPQPAGRVSCVPGVSLDSARSRQRLNKR